ncbi:hypothetical protein MMAN_16110 [Mycobacterium mantenii]|uniref:Uncharacterized protein n=1 Tax=Mycobacterium mantenii TaxID=560555 RepID=A0ABM7JPP2_MYCNT|nr:hypothetical protein MMAN_16110 [Mycobacterium mantenii]
MTQPVKVGVLIGIEHIHRREPPCRLCGQRPQHPPEPLDQGVDSARIEHIGAVFHRPPDTGGFTGLGPVFSEEEHQIHSRSLGIRPQRRDLQITQSQPGSGVGHGIAVAESGEVLPGKDHLNQWVMGQASGGVEPIDQHLKRHILMLEGGHAALPHLRQQLDERGIPRQVHPQHQRVDEETHQFIECRVAAPGDRESHGHIGTGTELGQQDRQGGLNHHEAGCVVLVAHPGNVLL